MHALACHGCGWQGDLGDVVVGINDDAAIFDSSSLSLTHFKLQNTTFDERLSTKRFHCVGQRERKSVGRRSAVAAAITQKIAARMKRTKKKLRIHRSSLEIRTLPFSLVWFRWVARPAKSKRVQCHSITIWFCIMRSHYLFRLRYSNLIVRFNRGKNEIKQKGKRHPRWRRKRKKKSFRFHCAQLFPFCLFNFLMEIMTRKPRRTTAATTTTTKRYRKNKDWWTNDDWKWSNNCVPNYRTVCTHSSIQYNAMPSHCIPWHGSEMVCLH